MNRDYFFLTSRKFSIWLDAARPKTLAAALVPVMVGASLAWNDGVFRIDTTIVALFCAFAIQIGTNFANDYFDFIKGADTDDRVGFQRATATGLISSKAMLNATIVIMSIAFLAGLYLVWVGGFVVLIIGILSLLFGILYTGGPFPLGYNGLGDLFVFIFFGFVAVMGTYYVNALEWSMISFWASIPVGVLAVNILVVNNLRDIEQDKVAGKNTLGVMFGEKALKFEYIFMALISYPVLFYFYTLDEFSPWIFLPLLSLPFLLIIIYDIQNNVDKSELNQTLEQTAQFMILFGALFTAGILI